MCAVLENKFEIDCQPVIRVLKPTDDSSTLRDFTPLAFLAELSCHIPNTWEQTVRYMGEYSARTRGAKRLALAAPDSIPIELPNKPSANWARCMRQVFEFDPLICSKCGAKLHIKAFIQNSNEISRLCKNLGIIPWRAPPALNPNPQKFAA